MFGRDFEDILVASDYATLSADGITNFDLTELEPYHEIAIASAYVYDTRSNITINFDWYNPKDELLFTYTWTPPASYTWAWAVTWIGYCPWEIKTNGLHYVKITSCGNIKTIYFNVTGVSEDEPIPNPGKAKLLYTLPPENCCAKPAADIIVDTQIENVGPSSALLMMQITETRYRNGGTVEWYSGNHISDWAALNTGEISDVFRKTLSMHGEETGDFVELTFKGQTYLAESGTTITDDTKTVLVYAGGFLTFKAQTPERDPLPNAAIIVTQEDHPDLTGVTDSSGRCELAVVPPLKGTAIASHKDYKDAYSVDLDITSYENSPIFLRLMPLVCEQKFIVAAEDGTLLEGAEVMLRNAETEEYINRAETDSAGECTIAFSVPYYKAKACCAGYECRYHGDPSRCNPGSISYFSLTPKPPETILADPIIKLNAVAMANALYEFLPEMDIPNLTLEPFICPICGESFNTAISLVNHIGSHLAAYEEQRKEWLYI